jgi:hypothetical protein
VLIAVSLWSPTPRWRLPDRAAVDRERRALDPVVGSARTVRVHA